MTRCCETLAGALIALLNAVRAGQIILLACHNDQMPGCDQSGQVRHVGHFEQAREVAQAQCCLYSQVDSNVPKEHETTAKRIRGSTHAA